MLKIDKVEWGKIEVNGKKYGQVVISGDQVTERDSARLHQLFDTTHEIGDWEVEELFNNSPEVIVIGTGWAGVLSINEELIRQLAEKSEKLGVELKILRTPKAVEEYNQFVEQGKKVNALLHTTC